MQAAQFIFIFILLLFSISLSIFKTIPTTDIQLAHHILFSLRLPRTLSAFVAGGMLALAGCQMQLLMRNPLADPYMLGISGGAALAALICIILGMSNLGLTAGAWLGSLATVVFVFFIARGTSNTHRLLLTGVAIASAYSACISFILLISTQTELRSMLFWLLGDLSFAHYPLYEGIELFLSLILSFCLVRPLSILQRGEQEARALGVNVNRLQLILYLMSSGLTAAAVTLGGCIGFVGLIVPHFLRLLGWYDLRLLIPGSVLFGGTLVTLADFFARNLFAPQQLPLSIFLSLLGIPVFLLLLQKQSHVGN